MILVWHFDRPTEMSYIEHCILFWGYSRYCFIRDWQDFNLTSLEKSSNLNPSQNFYSYYMWLGLRKINHVSVNYTLYFYEYLSFWNEYALSVNFVKFSIKFYISGINFVQFVQTDFKLWQSKFEKSRWILCAYMVDFRRPSHICVIYIWHFKSFKYMVNLSMNIKLWYSQFASNLSSSI